MGPSIDVRKHTTLGLALCVAGLLLPWITHTGGFRTLAGLDVVIDSRACSREWFVVFWGVHGLMLSPWWCRTRRGDLDRQLAVAWIWVCTLGVASVVALIVLPRSPSSPWVPYPGFFCSLVGAGLVGVSPLVELSRMHHRTDGWFRRPGRDQARRALSRDVMRRLPRGLQRLVCEARTLRAYLARVYLTPRGTLDAEQSRALADVVQSLRSLDDQSRDVLLDHGLSASSLLDRIAPAEPPREWFIDEALRIDEALVKLVAVGFGEGSASPYR